jgi:hypothetical protein
VIRTTDIIASPAKVMLFGTFKGPGNQFTETTWLNISAVSAVLPGVAIGAATNARIHPSAAIAASGLDQARMVPSAVTVQIINPEALQTTDGIAFIGRSKVVLDLMGDTRTWEEVAKELVAYSAPRQCSAAKLAMRGVQVNAIPNNMSVLSDFVPRRYIDGGTEQRNVTWGSDDFKTDFEGFAPIFVYNPSSIGLQYLVTVEWRMRFDPMNPAYAGHTTHQPASEATWAKVVSDAESHGHGVQDISDVVGDKGSAPY